MENTVLTTLGTSLQTIYHNLVMVMGTVIVGAIAILAVVIVVHEGVVFFKQVAFHATFDDRYEWHDNGMGGGHYTRK